MANWDALKQKLAGNNDDDLARIAARQEAQQANVLPTERQPPMQALAKPEDEALQNPAISPEDVLAGGLAQPLARSIVTAGKATAPALGEMAKPAFQGIRNLVADEAGHMQLPPSASLPMDEASRMARAKEMGFDTGKTYYHGTKGDIDKFDLLKKQSDYHSSGSRTDPIGSIFLSENPSTASYFANVGTDSPAYIPIYTGPSKSLDEVMKIINQGNLPVHQQLLGDSVINDMSNGVPFNEAIIKSNSPSLAKSLGGKLDLKKGVHEINPVEQNVIPTHLSTKKTFDYENRSHINDVGIPHLASGNWEDLEKPEVIKALKNMGYDSMFVREDGSKNIAVFDPKNIRSKFAAFDPSKASSGNLSAGLAGVVGAGGAFSNLKQRLNEGK